MLHKSLESLTEAYVRQAIDDRRPEGKQLEYKETLPGKDHDDKKEFLADVSAMANAAGGLIIYGVAAERDATGKTTGAPKGPLVGLPSLNTDAEILRLENLLRTGLKPPVQGVDFHPVELENGKHVLLVKIPRSWNPPHVVDFERHWRFYGDRPENRGI